jgi:asparagine N-glycosylation enzyme membrane subunit Stt3
MGAGLRGPPVREIRPTMDTESGSWWSRHGWTATILLTAFALAFLVRVIFAISVFDQWGWLYVFGGGSDSFYHWRVTEFILTNHTNLIHDPLLKYPLGAINPREPLFDWMNAILGIVFAPFFGGSAVNAAAFFLNLDPPLWSALTVFLIYLIGKEVSSERMGLIAAVTYPFIVGSIQAAGLGYANYLTFYTFFILIYFYAYLRTAKLVSTKTYITSFRHPQEFLEGLRRFFRGERRAVKWAFFTGVSLGALALAWQGYPLAVAIVVIFLAVIMVVERIRRIDSVNLYLVTWIAGLVGFPMAVPYYLGQGLFATWFDLPLLIYFGALIVLLPFVLLRQYPWVVTVPLLAGVVLAGLGAFALVAPASFQTLITGQGYFAKTLIYSTVAEAQAPSFDALVLSYGVLTFFLAFVGLGLFIVHLVRQKFRREHALFVVFAIVSIYLPVSAAKFFYLGSPAFALLPAEALLIILDVAGYAQLRRTAASLSGARGQFTAIRRSFKARHVLVFLLVIIIVVPNVWYAIDAGIPYNDKATYSKQVYNSLPPFLRTNSSNASSFYLGASGTELDTPNQYDEAGYNWLATQDANLAPAARPAFVSWWDYGFQAIAQGQHPSVADNFQNGIPAAGNFLLAQNESLAIGVLATTLLQAEQQESGYRYLPPSLNAILAADGVNLPELHTLLANTSADIPLVVAHPDRYLPVNPKTITATNAMFDAVSWLLADSLTENGVAQVYNDIQAYTGWSIRYAMVDDRLFPFTGTDTGIFYAPAELTGRIIGLEGAPTTYFTVEAVGSDGNEYPVNAVPAGVSVVNYVINQLPPFYNSMLYRTYMGYNGTDIGLGAGIPGLEGSLTGYNPEPGWMLQHFEVVYRTAYYSPQHTNSTSVCDLATNLPQATALAAKTNGTANLGSSCYFNGGEAILAYYPGQTLSGTVTLPDGAPIAGARLTVYDSWNIPHMTAVTGSDGAFSMILPPGNDTLNVTSGPLQGLGQNGTELLQSIHLAVDPALGFSVDAPPISQTIVLKPGTVDGFVFWNVSGNSTYNPSVDPVAVGANVTLGGPHLANYTATTDSGGAFRLTGVAPGVYNYTVHAAGATFHAGQVAVPAGGAVNATAGLVPSVLNGTVTLPSGAPVAGATVSVSNSAGFLESTTSNASGGYSFGNLVRGNYSVGATLGTNLAANATSVFLNQTANSTTLNLSLVRVVAISFEVEANGAPVPGFTVRLTPLRDTSGKSASGAPLPSNALVFTSDPSGYVHATLPIGNYSIYGYGPVGSTFLAGFESAYFTATGPLLTAPALALSPAASLSGQSPLPAGVSASTVSATQIALYDSVGNELTFFANSSGLWSVMAPIGNYSVQALAVGVSGSALNYSAVGYVDLNRAVTISLPLTTAFKFQTSVGARVPPSGTFFPDVGADVKVTVDPVGASITALTNVNGTTSFLLPASTPGTGYCLAVHSIGFGSSQACSLSVGELTDETRVIVPLLNDTLSVTVTGLPSGSSFHFNATSLGTPAQSRSVTDGGSFSVSLAPGNYELTAWSPPPSGSGVFLPPQSINTTLPVGGGTVDLGIQLFHQVNTTGTLNVPAGLSPAAVQLKVYSPPFNFTVNGSAFEQGFFLAPGTYSVYALGALSGVNYTSLSTIVVNATGVATPAITLSSGIPLVAKLVGPDEAVVNVTTPVNWTGPHGTSLYSLATDGTVSLTVPGSATYTPELNVTTTTTVNGVLRYATYTAAPGAACVVGSKAAQCSVPLSVSYRAAGLAGQLDWNGAPLSITGTIRLMGPYPSTSLTTVNTTSGRFTAAVLPGVYAVYATAGSGAGILASLSEVTVPFPSTNVTIDLSSAWTDTLTLLPPTGVPSSPAGNVTWTDSAGVSWTATGVPVGSAQPWVLPQGIWAVMANGTALPFGKPVLAAANATVTLSTGNQATNLALLPRYVPSVALVTLSPTAATVPDGGRATFSFTVQNTGDEPVTVRFYGDPASWNFNFTPATLTLGVGPDNSTGGGTVTITVPYSAPTNHAPVVLGAVLVSNSSQDVGTAVPAPTVSIVPVPGISVKPGLPATVTATSATVNFDVVNTGNTPYRLQVSVVNIASLEQLGWMVTVRASSPGIEQPLNISAGQSIAWGVTLSTTSYALPPGSVVVEGIDLNSSGAVFATLTIPVPSAAVSVPHGLGISGPGVGAPPAVPDWGWAVIAILPAVALLALVFTVRWWRTRRWVRR